MAFQNERGIAMANRVSLISNSDDDSAESMSYRTRVEQTVETVTTIEGRVENIIKDDEKNAFPHGNLYICCDFYPELRHPLLNEVDSAEQGGVPEARSGSMYHSFDGPTAPPPTPISPKNLSAFPKSSSLRGIFDTIPSLPQPPEPPTHSTTHTVTFNNSSSTSTSNNQQQNNSAKPRPSLLQPTMTFSTSVSQTTGPFHLNLKHREVSYIRKRYPPSLTASNIYEMVLIRDGRLYYRKMQYNQGIQSSTLLSEHEIDSSMGLKFKMDTLLVNKQESVLLCICKDKRVVIFSIDENFEIKYVSFLPKTELEKAHKWSLSNDGKYVAYVKGEDEVHILPLSMNRKTSNSGSGNFFHQGSLRSLFTRFTVYKPKEKGSKDYTPIEPPPLAHADMGSDDEFDYDEETDIRGANPMRSAPSSGGIGSLQHLKTLSKAQSVMTNILTGNLNNSHQQQQQSQGPQLVSHFQFTIPESRVNLILFEDLNHIFLGASNGGIYLWNHSAARLESFPKVHRKGITCMAYAYEKVRESGDEEITKSKNVIEPTKGSGKSTPRKIDFPAKGGDSGSNRSESLTKVASSVPLATDTSSLESANTVDGVATGIIAAGGGIEFEESCHSRLISGSFDRNVIVWDANPLHRRQLLLLTGHYDTISSVAISPDLNLIFTGSLDGSVLMWDAIMGAALHDFGKLKVDLESNTVSLEEEGDEDDLDEDVDERILQSDGLGGSASLRTKNSKKKSASTVIPVQNYISEVRLIGLQGERLMFSRFDGHLFMLSYDYSPRVISAKPQGLLGGNLIEGSVTASKKPFGGSGMTTKSSVVRHDCISPQQVDKIFINDEFRVIVASLRDGTVIIRDLDSHSQTVFQTEYHSLRSPQTILSEDGQLHLFSFKFPSHATAITNDGQHRNSMVTSGVAALPRMPSQKNGLGLIAGNDEKLCMQVFHPSLNPVLKLSVDPVPPAVSPCGSIIATAFSETLRVFRSVVDDDDECFLAEDFVDNTANGKRKLRNSQVFAIAQIAISEDLRFIATVQSFTYAISIWMYVDPKEHPGARGTGWMNMGMKPSDSGSGNISRRNSARDPFIFEDEEAAAFYRQQQHYQQGGGMQYYEHQGQFVWFPVWTESGHRDKVNALHFVKYKQEQYLCSTSDDWTVVVWSINPETGRGKNLYTFRDHSDAVLAICCFTENPIAISGDAGGNMKIWNYVTGSKNRTFKVSYTSKMAITSISLSDRCFPLVVVGTSTGEIFAYYEVHLKSLFRLQDAEHSLGRDEEKIQQRIGFISIPNILSYFQEKARKRQVEWRNFYENDALVRQVVLQDSMLFCNNLVHHIVIYDNAAKLLEEILRAVPHAVLLKCNRFTNDKERKMKEKAPDKDKKDKEKDKDKNKGDKDKPAKESSDKPDSPAKGKLGKDISNTSFESATTGDVTPRMGPVRRASIALFSRGTTNTNPDSDKKKEKMTYQQVYENENQGCATLLNRAIEKDCVNNIRVILDAYLRILTSTVNEEDAASREFWSKKSCRKTHSPFLGDDVAEFLQMAPHLSDEISIFELCKVAKLYPLLFLDFVKRLVIVRNYMPALSKDRMPLKKQYLLKPSDTRTVKNFWTKREDMFTTRWEMLVDEFQQFRQTINFSNLRNCFKLIVGKKIKRHDVAVVPYLVPIPDIAAIDSPFLRTLVMAADQVDDTSVFTNEVVKVIIAFKWKYFVKRKFTVDFLVNLVYFLTYLYTFLTFRGAIYLEGRLVLWVILLGLLGYLMFREVIQLFSGKLENDVLATKQLQELSFVRRWRGRIIAYVTNGWNLFNNLSYAIMLYSIILQIRYFALVHTSDGDSNGASPSNTGNNDDDNVLADREWLKQSATAVAAAALPCFIPNLLYYLSGFTVVGPTIRKIIKITNAVMFFVGIIVFITVTFAASFNLLFGEKNQNFGTFISSILTVIQFMNGVEFDRPNDSQFPPLDVVLRILYLGAVNIILLNLLIAIMGDIQTQVDENAEGETGNSRAKIVLEYEDLMILWSDWNIVTNRSKFNEYFPKWIQILGKENSFPSSIAASMGEKDKGKKENDD